MLGGGALRSQTVPPTDSPGNPVPRPPARLSPALAGLLLVNLALLGSLFFWGTRLHRRLDQLEAGRAADGDRTSPALSSGERLTAAGRPERIALLLAAATDAEGTRRLLESIPPRERVEIARTLIGQPAGNDRNAALGALLQKLADDDPGQAVTLLASVPETGLRQSFAAQIAAAWIEHDPAGGAAWLARSGFSFLARSVLNRLLASAVTRWAAFDPAAATRFAASKPPASTGEAQELRAASREWARKDPAAALAWAQSLPSGDPRRPPAAYGVLEGWTDLDPTQAAGYVGQLSYGANRLYAGEAAAVAARWTEHDPAAAARWAAGLPDRTARRDALQQVAASWTAVDVPSAARWAASLPASPERAELWRGIGESWADVDPAGVEGWLSTLPAGEDRDVAVAAYAAKVVPTDPEKALTWARTLSNGAFAAQQIDSLLAVWSRKDGLAARNWAVANQFLPVSADGGR